MAAQQLALCKQLYQATLTCKEQCERLVPSAFNAALLEALQHLMLQAVQLHQEEQLQGVRACLEAALQLLSRVSSLGPIEAFFSADELLAHYQWRLDSTHAALCRLGGTKTAPCCAAANATKAVAAAATAAVAQGPAQKQAGSSAGCDKCRLKLPDQQQQVVQSFRRQAAKLCPVLVQSCPAADLQQLCDTVKQGLVLVNGHSFLIGQEWHAEVTAMLGRAEQLKVLLAHLQAHHLSLLASVLQHLHLQEVQEFDLPRSRSGSPSKRPYAPMDQPAAHAGGALQQQQQQQEVPAGCWPVGLQQQQQLAAHAALHTQFHSMSLQEEASVLDDEDDFFLPVAPVAGTSSGSPNSSPEAAAAAAAGGLPCLPFHIPAAATLDGERTTSDGDGLLRTPSSGCSSLLEYVHNSKGADGQQLARDAAQGSVESSPIGAYPLQQLRQQQSLASIEQQLLSIAGSAEVAAVLASALGFEQVPCSRSSSYCGGAVSVGGASASILTAAAAAGGAALCGASFTAAAGRDGSATWSGKSSPMHSHAGSVVARLSSSASKAFTEGLLAARGSSSGAAELQHHQEQQQQQRRRWRRPQKPSSTLCLQHVELPGGCCRSIGVVCYLCPHLRRVALVGVGLRDQEMGDLVDALKVNSSILHLDLSHNRLEDIGARVLATLLRPSAGCSSRLRTLCLQHNQIGDDGAAALAGALAGTCSLQRLWLQHNAIGEAGAKALGRAMQHNTVCVNLRLQPMGGAGAQGMPAQLAQAVEQLARQNRGARDHMKGLLRLVTHWSSD